MRWLCTACQVQWTTIGEDPGLCFNGWAVGLDCTDHIKEIPGWEYKHWRFAAGSAPDYDRSEQWGSRP